MKMERASEFYNDNKGVILFLVGTCTISNFVAVILFAVEISVHNTWYNWLSTLLCLGMFVVSSLRREGKGCVKVLADTVFVLYGIITLSITSLSVGLAGDSPWGCGLENLFQCEHHPGMWGAMLFGIASITGHGFGWNRIKDQQTKAGFVILLNRDEWRNSELNPLLENDREDGGRNDNYLKYKNKTYVEKKAEYDTQVKWGFFNICVSILILLACAIIAFGLERIQLGALYVVAALFQLWKLGKFIWFTNYYGCDDTNILYSTVEKQLWFVIINLALIVWVVGANWHIVGNTIKTEKDLGWPLTSAILTTLVACLQHYII